MHCRCRWCAAEHACQRLVPDPPTAVHVQYNCEDIADDAVFHLATNNFLAGGGDGYEVFAALPRVLSFGPSLADALADYLDNNTPEGGVVCPPPPPAPHTRSPLPAASMRHANVPAAELHTAT